jgi:hypothetical protein
MGIGGKKSIHLRQGYSGQVDATSRVNVLADGAGQKIEEEDDED